MEKAYEGHWRQWRQFLVEELGETEPLLTDWPEQQKSIAVVWPNYGLCGGSDGTGREGKRKAAVVLVLLAKDVVSLQINTEIGKS